MKKFKDYISALQSQEISNITEHTHRKELHILLETIASEVSPKIKILHEPKRQESFGSPDFKIYNAKGILGYVENKKIEENLDKIIKSEQIRRYKELSDNILITNYIEFIWLKKDTIQRETLCYLTDIENKKYKPNVEKVKAVEQIICNFFSQAPEGLGRADELAKALALRSHYLRDFLLEELKIQEKDENKRDRLWGLKDNLQKHIFTELTNKEFADTYAQMLAYGLFLAKLNADTKEVKIRNLEDFIPSSFALIRELVDFLKVLESGLHYKNIYWIVEELLSLINNLDLPSIILNLTFKRNRFSMLEEDEELRILYEKDPYLYFYEEYLSAFDKDLRKSKGVYFTPPPVVNFIIRAIDEILKSEFGISDGFADRNKVTVLDFAAGTGSFLLQIFQKIFDSLPPESGKRDLIIKEHILKNIFGFEYLIAPYTVAHLKLSQFLKDNNYELKENERLQIYLTNTLEPVKSQPDYNFPELSNEGKKANEIKEKPILVITGNPPYSIHTKNKGKWIQNIIKDYKPSDEKKINEDDYIKFIRFAHYKMEKVEQGIIGIISNNSFLYSINQRKMRGYLHSDFNSIYILNLHGNTNLGEKCPDGTPDENVFDIKQGVAISIFVKNKYSKNKNKIYYYDLQGTRKNKYKFLYENTLEQIKFLDVDLSDFNKRFRETNWGKNRFIDDLNFFVSKRINSNLEKYGNFLGITEIFKLFGSGIKTDRDKLLVDFTKVDLVKKLEIAFSNKFDSDFKKEYSINNSSSYPFEDRIMKLTFQKTFIMPINFRPFDSRYEYYKVGFTSRPAEKVMIHIINKQNTGIVFSRLWDIDQQWSGLLVCQDVIDVHYIGGQSYIAPLYVYKENNGNNDNNYLFNEEGKRDNFTKDFRKFIKSKYKKSYSPVQILGYIYAVLYSPGYRKKYHEFLKIDFPRIPFPDNEEIFQRLSSLGSDLIEKQLMKEYPGGDEYNKLGSFKIVGDYAVEKPLFKISPPENNIGKLYINKTQYFDNVSKEVYEFYIGGYQVLDKYLKDRKGRILSIEEIDNVERIVKILAYTIKQMEIINKETEEWI